MNETVLYRERQNFLRPWWWMVLLISAFSVTMSCYPSERESSASRLFVPSGLSLFFVVCFYVLRLDTQITACGIRVRLFPFHLGYLDYPWEQIRSASVRQYNPVREYGGWGLKGSRENMAYNVSGNMGLQLELSDGRKRLIGTCDPEGIRAALSAAKQYLERQ